MRPDIIDLRDALSLLHERSNPNGNPIWHSVTFVTYDGDRPANNGRLVRMEKCRKNGLRCEIRREGESNNVFRRRVKNMDCIGLIDPDGNIRHVHIHLILEFDNMKVVW